jgi:hypothetical protein
MKTTLALSLVAVALGPCSPTAAPVRTQPSQPAVGVAPAPTVTPTPAPNPVLMPEPARAPRQPPPLEGLWQSEDAIVRVAGRARWLLVQRRDHNVAERLEQVQCSLAPMTEGGGSQETCPFQSEHCQGSMQIVTRRAIGGGGSIITIIARARSPQHQALCARIAGTVGRMQAGPVAPPQPNVPNAACMRAPMTFSAQFSACASTIEEGRVQTYTGPCCVGQPVARLDAQGSKRWVSDDGRTLVAARSGESLSVEQQATNAVFLVVAREGSTRELRVNDVFAGDPVLQSQTGFSFDTRIEADGVVIASIGGASHRVAFAQ